MTRTINGDSRASVPDLASDCDANGLAPLTHAGIADAVNGLVGPFHRRGGERLGIDVARRGVEGQRDEVGLYYPLWWTTGNA